MGIFQHFTQFISRYNTTQSQNSRILTHYVSDIGQFLIEIVLIQTFCWIFIHLYMTFVYEIIEKIIK